MEEIFSESKERVVNGRISISSESLKPQEFKATPLRWYILAVHSLIGIFQCIVYSTWGPIANSAEASFGLSQLDFALLPNWYNIAYFFVIWPFMWMIQNVDLRSNELVTAGLTALGATIRCLNFGPEYGDINRYIIHIGHAINGAGTPIPWMGCPYLSAMWFPPNERALATSLGICAAATGAALSSIIGPMYIHAMAPENPTNEQLHGAIQSLLYIEAAFCQLMLIVVIVYFPARPEYLPSYSAGQKRTPFLEGLVHISKNLQSWIMLAIYAMTSSIFTSWQQVLTIFVRPIIDEVEAGWMNFTVQILGIVAGPILSVTAVYWIDKHAKLVSVAIMTTGSCALGLVAIAAFIVPQLFTRWVMWLAMVISGITITSCQPVWWELACDDAYPVAESVVSGTFSLTNCIVSCLFFVVYMFPQLGTDWATWTLVASEFISIPGLLIYRPSNKRALCDRMEGDDDIEKQPPPSTNDETSECHNDVEMADFPPKDIVYSTAL